MKDTNNELRWEPMECHGLRDWGELTALRDGMYNNLENSIMWETGGDDKEAMEKVMVFNMVREITKYREGYMMRRIEQLEKALGIEPIGQPATN